MNFWKRKQRKHIIWDHGFTFNSGLLIKSWLEWVGFIVTVVYRFFLINYGHPQESNREIIFGYSPWFLRSNRSWEIPLLCGLVCAVLTLPMQRKRQNKITLSAAFLDKCNFPTCRLNQEKIISLTVSPAPLYCCYVAVYFNLSNHTFFIFLYFSHQWTGLRRTRWVCNNPV